MPRSAEKFVAAPLSAARRVILGRKWRAQAMAVRIRRDFTITNADQFIELARQAYRELRPDAEVIAHLLGELLANRVRTNAATLAATTAQQPAPRPRRARLPRPARRSSS